MKEHRAGIINAIWFHADNCTTEQWPGERSWEGIRKVVKGLVKRLKEQPELGSAETSKVMVKREALGSCTVYINVGEW